MQYSLNDGGGPITCSIHSMVEKGPLTCSIHSMVQGDPSHTACHSMVEGGTLTCSIHLMMEGGPITYSIHSMVGEPLYSLQHILLNGGGPLNSLNDGEDPSHTAFTGREHPSCVAFTQWWRGDPSHAAFTQWWRGPLTLIQITTYFTVHLHASNEHVS